MDDKKVWLWNVNLAWELFSNGIYNYRLSLNEFKEHKKHAYYKNVILNMTVAVEAYCNEILAREKSWSEEKLRCGIKEKLRALGIDYESTKFKESKFIRNELLVHYKKIDYRYFPAINQQTALEALESSQGIIMEISFNRGVIFPYWITGLNFTNPNSGNDISLLNDYEFWCRFKWLNVSKVVNDMINVNGSIKPPKERKIYESLFKELWQEIKKSNFRLKILDKLKSDRFPHMPFLTSEWWEEKK